MIELILIRGLPGSGKSTMASQMSALDSLTDYPSIHIETDMYWNNNNDKYVFKLEHLKDAHEWCILTTKMYLRQGRRVIVSNTFTTKWEMQRYLDLGYKTKIIEAKGSYKNIHNVPDEVIKKMADRWEPAE